MDNETIMLNVTHNYLISFIVPTMNNHDELERTLKSLSNAIKCRCQIVIVDSGESPLPKSILSEWNVQSKHVHYIHMPPKGIYSAINEGIKCSSGEWLAVMTAGDGLLPGAEKIILRNMSDENDILVFDQEVWDSKCKPVYTFKSSEGSLWPTQSVIINRSVYNALGLYSTDFSSISDQRFFWQARKEFNFDVIPGAISFFCLGGLSSTISIKLLHEQFTLNRYLGKNIINSIFLVLRTVFKRIIEKIFGETLMISLKRFLLRYSK